MKVFISYRREDSAGHTGRLYDSLLAHFGKDGVFMDLSGIGSGQNFVDVIHDTIRSSDVLIAVIGREWLSCEGAAGRRLDDPNDFVRTEIVAALERETPIIPVLVDGARMPSATSLPDALKPLATRDAHEISDERWSYDVGRLIDATRMLAGRPRWWDRRRVVLSVAASLAIVVILGSAYFLRPRQASAPGLQNADGYLARGTELLARADYDGAIAEFDRSLAIAPRSEGYYHRGLAHYFKKDTEKAIADWTSAIGLNAGDTRAYRQRGNAHVDKGDYDLAVADYTRAIEIDPKDAKAYHNRGVVFRARGEPDKARADFTTVLTLGVDPDAERDARAQLTELGPPRVAPADRAAKTAAASTPLPRAQLAGDWSAEVTYDWGAKHTERFALKVDGDEVLGTASFLGSPRGIVSGTLKGDRVLFQTRTQQVSGDWNKPVDVVHRYRGTISGDVIAFFLQSEGGASSLPVEFTARRVSRGR